MKEAKESSVSIDYRMTCERLDRRNICRDPEREKGYFWLRKTYWNLQDACTIFPEYGDALEFVEPIAHEVVEEQDIVDLIQKIPIIQGAEAIKVTVRLIYVGKAEPGDCRRLVGTFEYFRNISDQEITNDIRRCFHC